MGQEWVVYDSAIIGRDGVCDIALTDARISRAHGEIFLEDGHYLYRDRNSTNGSFINDIRIESQALSPGDRILLGATILQVIEDSQDSQISLQETVDCINYSFPVNQSLPAHQQETQERPNRALTQKRLQNLQTLYDVTKEMARSMVLEDLYRHLRKRLFSIFPSAWRICLLRYDEKRDLQQEFVQVRKGGASSDVPISSSVVAQAEERRAGIVATNLREDGRVVDGDQTDGRFVMCTPLLYRDRMIGALYLDGGREAVPFDAEDLALLTALSSQVAASIQNAALYENVQNAYHQAVLALVNMMETRDPYTIGHTQRTSRYALGMGQSMNLSPERLQKLKIAAQLHDIGKIGLKEGLLDKPESLSEIEYQSIREHVRAAERILSPIESLHDVIPIILGHHENFDGSGYPDRLKGEEILLESRILTVADAFDAMTTQRPYNKPLPFHEALNRCHESAGRQFDPEVVKQLAIFLKTSMEQTGNRRTGRR